MLTTGGFTASSTEATSALHLALAQHAAAAAAAAAATSVPPDRGVLTILDAASDVLLSHSELERRPGVPQAVLVIGAVDGGRSEDEHADGAPPALNLRRLATPVDGAAARMFNAALQLRNSTARAMAAGAGSLFPAQDTLRVAFVLSGTFAGQY